MARILLTLLLLPLCMMADGRCCFAPEPPSAHSCCGGDEPSAPQPQHTHDNCLCSVRALEQHDISAVAGPTLDHFAAPPLLAASAAPISINRYDPWQPSTDGPPPPSERPHLVLMRLLI